MKSSKKAVLATIAGLCAMSGTSLARADNNLPGPTLVGVQSEQIFAPPGFDSNDVAQIVVHGEYPNTCYRAAYPDVTLDRAQKTITVAPKAYLREGCWCAPVTVAFTQPIDLGVLEEGRYRIVEFDSRGGLLHESSLTIAPSASASPDDFLYAPVKNAQVVDTPTGRELVLSGTFSSSCLELQEVKTFHRTANVIEVLPITSYKAGAGCSNTAPRAFETRVKLPATEPGETLVHVRLLNGQALNIVEPF